MQAAIKTLTWPVVNPVLRTRTNGATMGERSFQKRHASSFGIWSSLFVDDCAIIFTTFGLRCSQTTKTEAIYFPPPRLECSNAGTSHFDIRNAGGSAVGFVDFTKEF